MNKYGILFKEYVNSVNNGEYKMLSDYVNNHTKVQLKHLKCGNCYWVRPKGFRDGNRCPLCNNKTKGAKQKTHNTFIKDVNKKVGSDYIVLTRYKGVTNPIVVKHICGNTYVTTPNKLLDGKKCRKCTAIETGIRNRKTDAEFKDYIKNTLGSDYTAVSKYEHSLIKVKLQHSCGYSWEVQPKHIDKSTRCPKCFSSKGEKLVDSVLQDLGLVYERQKRFQELKNKKRLSYDFYIPSLNLLIEYNGIQHYIPTQFGEGCNSIEAFNTQRYNDELKRLFALSNKIKLLIIPYTIDKKEDILKLIKNV